MCFSRANPGDPPYAKAEAVALALSGPVTEARKWAEDRADKLLALINSAARTPCKEEVVKVLMGLEYDGIL